MNNFWIAFGLLFVSTWIGAFGALFIKLGSSKKLTFKGLITNYYFILGAFFYLISTIPFITALKFEQLSVVYPMVAMSYVWVMILSKIKLKEEINAYKLWAVVLIFVGLALIGLSVS